MVRFRQHSAFILFVLSFLIGVFVHAQSSSYMVFFKDKNNTPYSINQPEEFLSERAIERRKKQNIPIDETDIPVNATYINTLKNKGFKTYFQTKWMNGVLVSMTETQKDHIILLDFVKHVELVAPYVYITNKKVDYTLSDPYLEPTNTQYTTQSQLDMLEIGAMHKKGWKGKNKMIAVFDAGFINVNRAKAFAHLHQNNSIIAQKDFVKNSDNVYQYDDHGTYVLSCIAGQYGSIFNSPAPEATFFLAVTEEISREFKIEEYNWLFGAEYADSLGVDVINASLGYRTFEDRNMDYTLQDLDGKTAVVTRAANFAASKGILVVNSAGNQGDNPNWNKITSPADSPNVLAVGAVDKNKKKVYFSSLGPTEDGRIKPDVVAMGFETVLINKEGEIIVANGTSYSTPIIAGYAAAVWSGVPDFSQKEMIKLFRDAGSQAQNPNNETGYGLPLFSNISTILANKDNPNKPSVVNSITIYPNPNYSDLIITNPQNEKIVVGIFDLNGKKYFENAYQSPQIHLNTRSYPKGMYFLVIHRKEGTETFKLQKK